MLVAPAPAPCSVIDLQNAIGGVLLLDQTVFGQAGIETTSPSAAEETALATSV